MKKWILLLGGLILAGFFYSRQKLESLPDSEAASKLIGSDDTQSCVKMGERIIRPSNLWMVFGNKWIWSQANEVAELDGPNFKREVMSILKETGQWDKIADRFEDEYAKNDPVFMMLMFNAVVGMRIKALGLIGYKQGRWHVINQNDGSMCRTHPVECIETAETNRILGKDERKSALQGFRIRIENAGLLKFCQEYRLDTVFSNYPQKINECDARNESYFWPSIEKYCESIRSAYSEILGALE